VDNLSTEDEELLKAQSREQKRLDSVEWLGIIWGPALGLMLLIYVISGETFVWGGWLPSFIDHWLFFLLSVCIVSSLAFGIGHSIDRVRLGRSTVKKGVLVTYWRIYLSIAALVLMVNSILTTPGFWFPKSSESESDPRFGTCGEAIDQGYGPYFEDSDLEFGWYRDADSDGVVCE
jgi:hypothetical protein